MSSPFSRWRRTALCHLFGFLHVGALLPVSAEAQPLTLTDALRRAEQQSPALAAATYHSRAAAGLMEQAALRPNPTVSVYAENFLGSGTARHVRALEATVEASQTFERGGKRGARTARATREQEATAAAAAVLRADILTKTAVAFVEALAAEERRRLAAQPVASARLAMTLIEQRQAAGAASGADLHRARAGLASAEAELERAEAQQRAALTILVLTWGGDPAEQFELSGSLRTPDSRPESSSSVAALSAHPRLVHQAAVLASARAALAGQRAEAVSDWTVAGGLRFVRETSDVGLVAGLSMPLPIRNRNQGNLRAARESLAAAEQTQRAVEAELRAEFVLAEQALASSHAGIEHLKHEIVPALEAVYATLQHAYDAGEQNFQDLLVAQRELHHARAELLQSQKDFLLAHVRLESLTDPTLPRTTRLLSSR